MSSRFTHRLLEVQGWRVPLMNERVSEALSGGSANLALPNEDLFDILSDMKTVTLRSLRRDAELLDSAAGGEELLVTRFGKPYVRIVPASQSPSFVGAGRHFGLKKPVPPDPIPQSEWKGLV